MTKNLAIGLLAVVVLVLGGYSLMKSNSNSSTYTDTTTDTTKTTTTPKNDNTPTVGALTLGTPTVETNSNFSASTSTVSLTGLVTPNGLQTSYWFEYGESTGLINRTPQQSIGSGFYAISAPAYITGLRANTSYSYRLMASNNLGTAYGNTYSFKTNTSPVPNGSKPSASTKSATSVARVSATINGQVNPNNWQTNYWFEYGTDSKFGNTTSITSIDQSKLGVTSSVSETLSALEPLTKYYFRLNAQNQFGTVTGATLSFTTSGPTNPGAPTVTTNSASNIGSTTAKLNAHVNADGADTTYWFEYTSNPSFSNIIGVSIGSSTTTQSLGASTQDVSVQANVEGLSKNTKYFYRVVAKNEFGTMNGTTVSFTTKN